MPWTVFPDLDRTRHQGREPGARTWGRCIATLIAETGASLRRRSSDEVAAVLAHITTGRHCVPCLTALTGVDARTVYHALERLRASIEVRLVWERCDTCRRATTVHVVASEPPPR